MQGAPASTVAGIGHADRVADWQRPRSGPAILSRIAAPSEHHHLRPAVKTLSKRRQADLKGRLCEFLPDLQKDASMDASRLL